MATVSIPIRVASATRQGPGHQTGPAGRDQAAAHPALDTIEEQRARAQREFKRIWNLCALPQ